MKSIVIVALATVVVTGPAVAQVEPFVTAGFGQLWAARHGFTDVAQYGTVTAFGGGVGLAFRSDRPLGVELAVDHYRSGATVVYDFNALPTGEKTLIATVTNVGLALRLGPPGGSLHGRFGLVAARQRGDVVLGRHETRIGLRGGVTATPFSVGRIRPGLQLNVIRYLNGAAGLSWVAAPGLRVAF